MKSLKYFAIVLMGVLASSCMTSRHNSAFSSMNPDEVRLNIDMHDMDCLGEVEISLTQDVYFGCIVSTRTVNGEKYDSWKKTTTSLAGATWGHKAYGMELAAGKVLEKYPNADFYKVVRETRKVQRMFCMKEVTRTATVKAYRLKAGNHGITSCGGCHHEKK